MIRSIPIAREADGTRTPALTNAQLNAILEEDLDQYRRVLKKPLAPVQQAQAAIKFDDSDAAA